MAERIYKPLTDEQRKANREVREAAYREFPPKPKDPTPAPPGIASKVKDAREERGLNWGALAQLAGVEDDDIRAIEFGRDVPLSKLQAVAQALELRVDLVADAVS